MIACKSVLHVHLHIQVSIQNEIKLFDLLSNPNFMNAVYLPVCASHPPPLSIFSTFGSHLFVADWETEVISIARNGHVTLFGHS